VACPITFADATGLVLAPEFSLAVESRKRVLHPWRSVHRGRAGRVPDLDGV